jgi:hypothetical protein
MSQAFQVRAQRGGVRAGVKPDKPAEKFRAIPLGLGPMMPGQHPLLMQG